MTNPDHEPETPDPVASLAWVESRAKAGEIVVVGPVLAKRCGVDVRTLYRHLATIGFCSRVHLAGVMPRGHAWIPNELPRWEPQITIENRWLDDDDDDQEATAERREDEE